LTCFASGFSKGRAGASTLGRPVEMTPTTNNNISSSVSSAVHKQISFQQKYQKPARHYNQHGSTLFLSQEETIEEEDQADNSENGLSTTDSNTDLESEKSRRNRRIKIALGLVSSIGALSVGAKVGILRGEIQVGGGYGPYTDSMILRDAGATALCAVLAVALVKIIGYGYENGWYNSKIGRKLNHTLAAPAFILFFPLFSAADSARFFAGLVTFSNILRLYLAGTGQGESSLAKTISRSGDKAEVLGGPFIYVCLFQLFIWFFWRNSPIGVVAMSTMAAGDGMADLIGRKWGGDNKWEFSDGSKSKVGTLAFIVFAFLTSFGLVNWLITTGCIDLTLGTTDLAVRLLLISVITAFVELVPYGDDNYTVPGTAAVLAAILLK
jgi:dolichol kinase